jgi:hypothetical protein
MRRYVFLALLLVSVTAHAMSTLRVDDKVLSIGDTAARVQQLLGPPVMRNYLHSQDGGLGKDEVSVMEQWQYLQDGKTVIVTIVNGRATDFDTKWN